MRKWLLSCRDNWDCIYNLQLFKSAKAWSISCSPVLLKLCMFAQVGMKAGRCILPPQDEREEHCYRTNQNDAKHKNKEVSNKPRERM